MHKFGMLLGLASMLLLGEAGAGERTPAARVLELKGTATILDWDNFDRPVAVFGTIYGGERIVVGEGAQVALVFRGEGQIERIAAPGTFTISPNGSEPRTGVERVSLPERHRATVGKISKGNRGIVHGGVVVVRSVAPSNLDDEPLQEEEEPIEMVFVGFTPVYDATLLEPKPKFSWPAAKEAKQYTLNLFVAGNRIWSANTEGTELEYGGQTPLKPGSKYTWEVIASRDGKQTQFLESEFRMASEAQRATMAELKKMVEDPDPKYLILAAMWYKQNRLLREAIEVNERLAQKSPDSAVYQELLELYYEINDEKRIRATEEKLDQFFKQTQ
ncbi:MAG: hypothetical protein FJ276_03480 [Planctomycetes bacterium]|nr:hypothetical protein [Planctomycetota bacterium]